MKVWWISTIISLLQSFFSLHFVSLSLQDPGIGNASLSTFGVVQAVVEIVLMMYPTLLLMKVCMRACVSLTLTVLQLPDGLLCCGILQPSHLSGTHTQEGRHHHDHSMCTHTHTHAQQWGGVMMQTHCYQTEVDHFTYNRTS